MRSNDREKPARNDWLAWSMYAVGGAVLGTVVALWIAGRFGWARAAVFGSARGRFCYFGGVALIFAALASAFGERFRTDSRSSIYMTHPEGFAQSPAGRRASMLIGSTGIAVFILAFYRG